MTPKDIILALSLSKSLSLKQLHLVRESGESWEKIFYADEQKIKHYGILKKNREYEGHDDLLQQAKIVKKRCEEIAAHYITFDDELYPKSLKQLHDAPLVLYCRGDFLDFNQSFSQCIAIVGTRKSDDFINQYTRNFAQTIGEHGLHVVSGLAEGVDSFAHRGALLAKIPTISVLAGGINHIYPYGNRDLYQKIIDNKGVIVSEHPPDTRPYSYFFPLRNRIIAALCRAVFLPQAPIKSGAMITVMHALEQGKSIYAFAPPSESCEQFGGNLQLQQSGAIMINNVEDFLRDFFLIKEKNYQEINKVNQEEKNKIDNGEFNNEEEILLLLKRFPRTTEEISQATGLNMRDTVSFIMEMRLKGLIQELPGNRFFTL